MLNRLSLTSHWVGDARILRRGSPGPAGGGPECVGQLCMQHCLVEGADDHRQHAGVCAGKREGHLLGRFRGASGGAGAWRCLGGVRGMLGHACGYGMTHFMHEC